MPDWFPYQDPFNRAAGAMQGQPAPRPQPGEVEQPPAPRRRSLFDGRVPIEEMLANADFGQPREDLRTSALPSTTLEPLSGPGGGEQTFSGGGGIGGGGGPPNPMDPWGIASPPPGPPTSPLGAAMKGASPEGMTENLLGLKGAMPSLGTPTVVQPRGLAAQQISGRTADPTPMKFQVGGAETFAPNSPKPEIGGATGQAAYANQQRLAEQWGMPGTNLVPASQLGAFRGADVGTSGKSYGGDLTPGKTSDSMAPEVSTRDQIMAMMRQPPPSAVSWYGAAGTPEYNPEYQSQMAAHKLKMETLNELLKGQNLTDYQKQELALAKEKLDLERDTANYAKGPQAKWDVDRRNQFGRIDAKDIGDIQKQSEKDKWDRDNPDPGVTLPAGGKTPPVTAAGASPPAAGSIKPPGPGGTTPPAAGGQTVPADAKYVSKALGEDVAKVLHPVYQPGHKKAGMPTATPAELFTRFVEYGKTHPGYLTPTRVEDALKIAKEQLGSREVDDWLKAPTMLGGVPAERMQNLLSAATTGGDRMIDPENEARSAFRSYLGSRAPAEPSGYIGGMPLVHSLLQASPAGWLNAWGKLLGYGGRKAAQAAGYMKEGGS